MADNTPFSVSELSNFTGTEHYYQLHPGIVLTDGAKYLAERANCFWLYDLVWSILPMMMKKKQDMLFVNVKKTDATRGKVIIHDGNNHTLYKQELEYTDFPLNDYTIYVQLGSLTGTDRTWVVMLPSEY